MDKTYNARDKLIQLLCLVVLFSPSSFTYAEDEKSSCFVGDVTRDNEVQLADCKEKAEQGDAYAQDILGWMYEMGNGVESDYKLAFHWYEKSAKQGHVAAQLNLARFYRRGSGGEQSNEKARQWVTTAAETGSISGQAKLAWMYYYGVAGSKSYEQAFIWYKKMAVQGSAGGSAKVGEMYQNGEGVEQNDSKALEWFKKAAEQGGSSGQYHLGKMYFKGNVVPQDYEKAIHWYEKSAEQLHEDALFELGKIYQEGSFVPRNHMKAYTYLQTTLTIKIGWHHFGPGPPRNIFAHRDQVAKYLTISQIQKIKIDIHNSLREKGYELKSEEGNAFDVLLNAEMFLKHKTDQEYHALMLFHYAAKYGSAYASQVVVDGFQQGTRFVDYNRSAEAFEYYKNRVQNGDSQEQLDLSYIYLHGYESHRSSLQALKWCLEATKPKEYDSDLKRYVVQPNKKPDGLNIVAMYLVAWMHDTAQGISQDYKQAFNWYQKAADLGYGDAQLRLAEMYQQGQGIEQNNDVALQWYKAAAEQGYNKAQRVLADLYRNGSLVEQDKKQAFEWYKKAAVLEELDAQYALAQMYATGEGVAKSPAQAYLFSNYLAKQYSHIEAQQLSAELAKEMTGIDLSLEKEWGEQWQHDAKYRTLGVAVEPPFDW